MLKVRDVDGQRMMIRVERGKGVANRDLPLCWQRCVSIGVGRNHVHIFSPAAWASPAITRELQFAWLSFRRQVNTASPRDDSNF